MQNPCLASSHLFFPAQGLPSTMRGSKAVSGPSGPAEGSPEGVDLSLTGLPPPVSRRPNSASAAKPIARSISMVTGSEPRRKTLVSVRAGASGLGVSRAKDLPQPSRPCPRPPRGSPRPRVALETHV